MNNTNLQTNLSFAHLNCRSLFTGFGEICDMVKEKHFSIFAVTETWLSDNITSDIVAIQGYRFFRNDRLGRGGGVGVYVNNTFTCEQIHFDVQNESGLEYLWIELKINKNSIAIGVVYRPPHSNVQRCVDIFDNILPQLMVSYDNIIVLGDVNINLFGHDNLISECFDTYGFLQTIDEPTRITQYTSTLLDPIFVRSIFTICESGTINADVISDHRVTYCNMNLPICKQRQKIVTFRDFKHFDNDAFHKDLLEINWDSIYYASHIDEKIHILNENIVNLFNIHAPLKTVRVNKPHAPWLTENLKKIMKMRDTALRNYNYNKTDVNWIRYKNLRNFTLASIRREKAAYLKFLQEQNNQKDLWRNIKNMNIKRNNDIPLPPNLQNSDEVNDFFITAYNKGQNCDDTINFYKNSKHLPNVEFKLQVVDPETIRNATVSLKSNAYGLDKISLNMIKLCMPAILYHVTHILNCCIEVGYFPESWKTAIIKPIPKINLPNSLRDLRPISLLPILSKILEKIIYWQIYQYFIKHNLFPKHQSGFRKGYGTTSALLNLTDNLIRASDKKQATVIISLDYSKAFDTIDHDLLCAKLQYYGFDEISIQFFNSYLKGRYQQVVISERFSKVSPIISGVPQGSILGPLLFIIYTSDIFNHVEFSQLQTYADDSQISHHFDISRVNVTTNMINADLKSISAYSYYHNLKLNPDKSSAILFCPKNKRDDVKNQLNLQLNNTPLAFSNLSKNLGLLIDEDLRFSNHVSKLIQQAYMRLKLLFASRHILNVALKKKLCESLILPIFSYCNIVYFPCLDSINKNRIQKIQNTCCRYIYNMKKFDHISSRFKQLMWLNMSNTVNYHLLVFVHKLLHTLTPDYLKEKLISRNDIHNVNIRCQNTLTMPQHVTAFFTRSFTFNAIKLYNSLNNNYKSFSIHKFRKAVKLELLNKDNIC